MTDGTHSGPGAIPLGVDTYTLLAEGFFPTHAPRLTPWAEPAPEVGIAALLTGTAFLVGDLAYVLGNVPLWCGVGPMGGGCGAPTNGVDDDLTLGLGIAGGLLLATGVISFIVGFTRRPDEQTRERRHEIREQIRRDVIELRLAGSGLRLTF